MSTKPTRGQPLGRNVGAARRGPRVPVFAVAIGLLVVVVVAAAIGIAVLGGDDDAEVTDAVSGAPIEDGGSPETLPPGQQAFAPVTVEGEPLAELPDEGDDPAVGEPAPTLVGETPSGDPVTIDPTQGPMVVAFLAHWCPHCQAEVPRIVELASEEGGTTIEGVPFAAVLTASDPALDNYPPGDWLAREGWTAPAMVDSQPESGAIPDAFGAYGVSGYPFLVAIDADGDVAVRSSGELGEDGLRDLFAQVAE